MKVPPTLRSFAVPSLAIVAISLGFHSAASAATQTWDGDTNTTFGAAANWVSGTAPSLSTTNDVASFAGVSLPTNQPTWDVSAASTYAIGGLEGGNGYAATLTINTGASRNITLGGAGIDTGSQLFTIRGISSSDTINFDVSSNQTWTIGSGGLLVDTSADPDTSILLIGTGTLTKNGSGTMTWNSGATSSLQSLVITEGAVVQTAANGRIVTNTGGSITLNGSTAVLRQSGGAVGGGGTPTTITVGANGGTFQSTGGPSHTWSANNVITGIGNFTLDMGFMPTNGNISFTGNNSGYTGVFTVANAGTNNTRVTAGNAVAFGDGSSATHGLNVQAAGASNASVVISTGVNLGVGTLSGNASAIISTADGAANVATLTVNQHQAGTYAGTFSRGATSGGTFNLVKSGTGALTIAGNSSATWDKGTATINAGTLLVSSNNALGMSAVSVDLNNATLGNTSTGLSLANSLTTAGTSSILDPTGGFTLGALNAANGVTLKLDATETISLTGSLVGAGTAGAFVLDLSSGFTTGSSVTIVNFGSTSGVDISDFALSASASTFYTLDQVTIDGDSVDITLGVVPEPSTMVLLGGGLVLFLLRRRTV